MGETLDMKQYLPEDLTQLHVLNLGAGYCASPVSSQIIAMPFDSLVNVEMWYAAYSKLVKINFSARVVQNILDDAVAYANAFTEMDHFDVVLMIDFFEHLKREVALPLLQHCLYISKRVVIFLPIGSCPQDDLDGNPYQKHLSTWAVEDFVDAKVHLIKGQHVQFSPPVDAAWVVYDTSIV